MTAAAGERLKIGVSVRLMHPDPSRSVLPGKTVHYAEDGVPHWILSGGALALLIPAIGDRSVHRAAGVDSAAYADALDGLVLQGGSDVAPENYGEKALRAEWAGDPVRDRYEIDLLRAFAARKKPVLGICRGCQLINVALGGTLFQDLSEQHPEAGVHRREAAYDRHHHEMEIVPESRLARLFPGSRRWRVNSIHHQAIRTLGEALVGEARSVPDGVIEAIRWQGDGYIAGVQWHPEFMATGDDTLLDGRPILREFLEACAAARTALR